LPAPASAAIQDKRRCRRVVVGELVHRAPVIGQLEAENDGTRGCAGGAAPVAATTGSTVPAAPATAAAARNLLGADKHYNLRILLPPNSYWRCFQSWRMVATLTRSHMQAGGRPMDGVCYVDGEFVPANEAKVSVFDRGYTGGEGVYDCTRSFGHKLFQLDQHMARLYRSIHYTHLDCDIPIDEMTRLTNELFDRNKYLLGPDDDWVVWNLVSRGAREGSGGKASAIAVIFCVPVAFARFARDYLEGAMLMTPSIRRTQPQSLESRAKICNKMNHVMALYEAQQVDPRCMPLMLDVNGNISELHMANFFFVSGGKLCTSTERNVLAGISRATTMTLARELGIPVVEGDFTPYDVYVADEAFYTSVSPSIAPVKSLNGTGIGRGTPGPITLRLIKKWGELVGLDFVGQAIAHLKEADKQKALGEWAELRDR
jgi:branched-chain amino acid aminotransferase